MIGKKSRIQGNSCLIDIILERALVGMLLRKGEDSGR